MGLDTSYDCWNGPYSSFTRWRNALSELGGYPLIDDVTSHGTYKVPSGIDWDSITKENLNGDWEKTPEDPLLILICHYDCEGHICKEHTLLLADRLVELLCFIKEDNEWLMKKTITFIEGLKEAHLAGDKVGFH